MCCRIRITLESANDDAAFIYWHTIPDVVFVLRLFLLAWDGNIRLLYNILSVSSDYFRLGIISIRASFGDLNLQDLLRFLGKLHV